MELLDIARRVKLGVKLLDRKIPNWRTVLRKHEDVYDFENGDYCVLGTLEHYSGRMQMLAKKRANEDDTHFGRALSGLRLEEGQEFEHGFDSEDPYERNEEMTALDALWRAEFEKA